MLIDMEALEELEEALEQEGVSEIAVTCIEELAEAIDDLQSQAASENEADIRRLAHKIKGCAASICADALSSVAGNLQDDAWSAAELSGKVEDLKANFENTVAFFNDRYADLN